MSECFAGENAPLNDDGSGAGTVASPSSDFSTDVRTESGSKYDIPAAAIRRITGTYGAVNVQGADRDSEHRSDG